MQKLSFENKEGQQLSGRLELPADQHPKAYAIFAHCFTCNKNLSAVNNIARGLTQNGIAVLRFDFTGLGESEGAFEDTNFSSNVSDLLAAADFLEENYETPKLLIGHSLGGAAVILAAANLPKIQAVVTIGAPSSPAHVSHLFENEVSNIESAGSAKVQIGGRPFTIQKQFLEDIQNQDLGQVVKGFNKALLVFHSPQDTIVGVENAAKIYQAAHHPKSFVSLDGADHLLSAKTDSIYVGEVISAWVKRYIHLAEAPKIKSSEQVAVRLGADKFTAVVKAGKHRLIADEPVSVGGNDFGPAPYELVSAGLGACTAMTMKMYADRKEWEVEEFLVHINHSKVTDENGKPKDLFQRKIEIKSHLDESQLKRVLAIANKCPVHRSLEQSSEIETELI